MSSQSLVVEQSHANGDNDSWDDTHQRHLVWTCQNDLTDLHLQ